MNSNNSSQVSRAIRTIINQIKVYNKDKLDGLMFDHDEKNALKVNFTLFGPKESCWEDCVMFGYLLMPETYPFKPPKVVFTSKTNHPNIYLDGKVCISYLNDKQDETGYFRQEELWTPVLDLRCIFLGIITLFTEPNLESPANLDACILYRDNRKEFIKGVRKLFDSNNDQIIDIVTTKLENVTTVEI
jgi:ubiquitin-conjugating enzyme E2 G2